MIDSKEDVLDNTILFQNAQTRTHLCSLVNVHFIALPDTRFIEHIRSEEHIAALQDLSSDLDLHPDLSGGASLMLDYIHATFDIEAAELSEILGVERTKLYSGVSPDYGPPPPYEAVWMQSKPTINAVLQELAEIYHQSGMALAAETMKRLDYIGVELDYQRLLALREAEAWQENDEEKAKGLLQQQAEFLNEHIGRWISLFIEKALPMTENNFYRGHMIMLRGLLAEQTECIQLLLQEIDK